MPAVGAGPVPSVVGALLLDVLRWGATAGLLALAGLVVGGEVGEGSEWKRRVGRWAAGDEHGGQGEGSVGRDGSLEGVLHWNLADGGALVRGVEGLNGENGASNGQVALAGDERGGTKVCAGSDVLDDRREGDEAQTVKSVSFDRQQ